ncbi:MAG: 50S ribosomal protein L16 [uncultured bacterium]|nr:MAG: 50S ribosomal protein L16 [uncultured bacterium]HBD05270.1 50S ribosomal protein L16 [Candidatus Uhrbacteria bacterium]
MLLPKTTKHRKWHKGRGSRQHPAQRMNTIAFGEYGLKAITECWVTSRQIEAARRAMTHELKRGGKIWIRIFPHKPVTIKGSEIPMGMGKGAVDHYVAAVKPGTVMFELAGVDKELAHEALRLAGHKLPVQTKVVEKNI